MVTYLHYRFFRSVSYYKTVLTLQKGTSNSLPYPCGAVRTVEGDVADWNIAVFPFNYEEETYRDLDNFE